MARRRRKKTKRMAKRRRVAARKPRNLRALRARGVHGYKRARFHACNNRDIRNAINVSHDPTQRAEAKAFLKKCLHQIKPSQVGKRGGISRGNYRYLLEKVGTRQQMGKFLLSSKRRTMFERAQYGF